jgi:hypothetical protein
LVQQVVDIHPTITNTQAFKIMCSHGSGMLCLFFKWWNFIFLSKDLWIFFLSFVSFVMLMIYISIHQPYNLRFEALAYHKIGFYFLMYDFILFIFGWSTTIDPINKPLAPLNELNVEDQQSLHLHIGGFEPMWGGYLFFGSSWVQVFETKKFNEPFKSKS